MAKIVRFSASGKGYGAAGASYQRRALRGFTAESGSPREDIDLNNQTLRERARMLYMAAPIATSAIKTPRTSVIGLGLRMNPKIDRDFLKISSEEAEKWEKKAKAEFALWAEDKSACDATGINNFYGMQQLAFVSWLVSGDVFVLKKSKDASPWNPYTLRLHLIEADRCATPESAGTLGTTLGKNVESGNVIYDGVEVDKDGMIVAYHFRNKHPYEITMDETEYKRVLAYGEKTGMPNVLHVMNAERPEQYRGVSYLAQIIEPLLQIRRYTESEIMAALVESFFTAFIKTNTDASELPLGEVGEEGEQEQASYDPNEYEMGYGNVISLNPGEDVEFGDPKRPASGFSSFVKEMCTQMGAALEIPRDILMKEYNSSYSASRGALLEAWRTFRMYRGWFVDSFCKPVYNMWLTEAVARGRISAPGFFLSPLVRSAWLGCEWIGPTQGQLDPVKEVTSEIMSVVAGFSTNTDAAIRVNGSDWSHNMDQIQREEQKRKEIYGYSEEGTSKEKTENKILNTIYNAVRDAMKEAEGENQN